MTADLRAALDTLADLGVRDVSSLTRNLHWRPNGESESYVCAIGSYPELVRLGVPLVLDEGMREYSSEQWWTCTVRRGLVLVACDGLPWSAP